MIGKMLLFLGLIVVFPVLSSAAWFFNTQVKSGGGNIVSPNKATPQIVSDGSLFKSYTTLANLPVSVTADTGYSISNVTVNGSTAATGGSTYSTTVAGPADQSVTATFLPGLLSLTATAGYGGRVDKSSISNIYYGTKVITAIKFRFYPNPTTFNVSNVTGVPAGATVTGLPAAAGASVYVTFPVDYIFTDSVALNGTFSGPPVAITGVPQTVKPGTPVTLDGSASTGTVVDSVVTAPVTSYTWAQTAGPAVSLVGSGSNATFTPTVEGTYTFRLTVTGGSYATTNVVVTNSPVNAARNSCQNCHQGNGVGVSENLFGNWSTSSHKSNYVMCPSCHAGADTGGHPGYIGPNTVDSSTFNFKWKSGNFCFSCHHKANNLHYNAEEQLNNICVACHVPNSHNPAATMLLAVGYNHFNGYTSNANPDYSAAYVTPNTRCANCHITANGTPDAANDSILLQERTDWAVSGHGSTKGPGWIANDFKTLSGCVQCHTSIGFIAYSTGKMTSAWGTASDKTRNVLSCNGCHTDIGTGALRTATPIRPYAGDAYANPESSTSNLCLKCHSGMQSGRSIKAQAAANADFTNLAFIDSHSSAAAGIVFRSAGYEFAFKSYSNSRHFKHDRIGNSHFRAYGYDTGSDGPCVGCHMTSSNKHSFSPLVKDANGAVTSVNSASCTGCHTGPAYLDPGRMNAREAKFAASLLALQKVLEARGIYYTDEAPYFFRSAGNADPGNAFTNWGNADTMGAAFNFNLLQHEAGAYAHNMIYTKRLIYDSIDFLDNGLLDNSVNATINGLAGLSADQKATAAGYLVVSGGRP